MRLMIAAGVTEARQAGTVNAAASLGMLDRAGTLARGTLADVVPLAADPLEDISATKAVRAVVADGRLFLRPALDSRWLRPSEKLSERALEPSTLVNQ